jgi:hypothetical protein
MKLRICRLLAISALIPGVLTGAQTDRNERIGSCGMWRWIVVFGIFVGLLMGWMQPAGAQQSFGPTVTAGDVGTHACRVAQLAVQGAVGNQTSPQYKNHGQYVSTAAQDANVPLAAGEITEACHSCIVSQFAQSIPVANQAKCGPDLCDAPGEAGWQNVVRPGGNTAFTSDATPQACCLSCAADPNCAQWAVVGSTCEHNVPPNQCVGSPTAFTNSGMISCP